MCLMCRRDETEVTKLSQNNPSFFDIHTFTVGNATLEQLYNRTVANKASNT